MYQDPIERKIKRAQYAAQKAKERAKMAMWNMELVIFLFAILIAIVILLFQGFSVEFVAPIALFGLAMVWLVGRRQGKHLYELFYREELRKYDEFEAPDVIMSERY